ncbi:MAG: peptidoglycan amidohydrolase family protein [Vagococcus sp.]|uniref:peptidoglycan amidohydrolase family protein n=1 Tax=Vagococcus sp. TaxID=1933889 RepID=UPI002FC62F7E
MAINLDQSIEWFKSKVGKVTYSMTGKRDGSDGTGDCSGMVVTALVNGGAKKPSWLVNTEYMHDWLISNGFELIAFNKSWNMKKGDVIILGLKGQSNGAAGHTFMAVDGTNAIDCAWYGSTTVNAVRIRNENVQPYSMGFYVYRLKSDNVAKPTPPAQSNVTWHSEKGTYKLGRDTDLKTDPKVSAKNIMKLTKGSTIKYDKVAHIDGFVWLRQPRSNGYAYIQSGKSINNGTANDKWGEFY